MAMNRPGVIVTITAIVLMCIGVVGMASQGWISFAFSTVSFLPLLVSLVCAFAMPKPRCQLTLCIGSILNMAWMLAFAIHCFVITPGPLAPIAFIAGPIYSFPAMAIVWIVAAKKNSSEDSATSTKPRESRL